MNTKRMRSRYHRPSNGGPRHQNGQASFNRNHVFDSNGPDVRVRGTAQQLCEKYQQHGRDALSSGDRVAAESFFQYADHYSRILNMMNQASQQRNRNSQQNNYSENTNESTKDSGSEDSQETITQDNKTAEAAAVENIVHVAVDSVVVEPVAVEPVAVVVEEEVKPAPRPARRGRPARADKKKVKEEEI